MSFQKDENSIDIKLCLIGDMQVGKTSIIKRYILNQFSPEEMTTFYAKNHIKTLQLPNISKNINLIIWDTAGQEKFRAVNKIFYKGAKIIILVYDITKKESFLILKNYWINQLKEDGIKDYILGLAGNKYDLYENEQINEEEGRKFANSINANFYSVSAKNDYGINDMFIDLCKKYCEVNKDNIDKDDNDDNGINLSKNDENGKKKNNCCKGEKNK